MELVLGCFLRELFILVGFCFDLCGLLLIEFYFELFFFVYLGAVIYSESF